MEPVEPLANVCPHVPPRVARVVDQCLEQDKDKRPESIWAIESELMGVLNESGLLPKCRELVSASPSQIVFKTALTNKRDTLIRQVEVAKQDKKPNKKFLLSLANEFQRLFPEDPTGLELLALLRGQKAINWKHPIVLAPLFLILVTLFLFSMVDWSLLNKDESSELPPPVATKKPQEPVVTKGMIPEPKKENPKPAVTQTVIKPKPKPVSLTAKPKPKLQPSTAPVVKKSPLKPVMTKPILGTLSFDVDEDVDIFIDGKQIPREQLMNFKVKPGVHKVKMIKAGFDPINNEIEVKANKTTTIRARGGA